MRSFVVDASAYAAVVFGEDGGLELGRRIQGGRIYAPSILQYELQQVALTKCRRIRPAVASSWKRSSGHSTGASASGGWSPTRWMCPAGAGHGTLSVRRELSLAGGIPRADLITLDKQLAAAHDAMAIA